MPVHVREFIRDRRWVFIFTRMGFLIYSFVQSNAKKQHRRVLFMGRGVLEVRGGGCAPRA